ncbi:OapC/ArvC family zinc-ribbon domain-containing protein [Saliphagus infecundisoli]|uniref:Zn-ribbon containing protein n=1 Tax=Saliphagus infecundisoli TaxID=1849069 RepID=A0ABD5QAA5_9EURY|nr:Zn-ribbon containing protein [Saliphagus infecundisoli]
MPHQCTNCGRRFPDGSKEMLSGCPDCGGNRFQFTPDADGEEADAGTEGDSGATGEGADTGADDPAGDEAVGEKSGTVSRAAATVRDWMSESGAGKPDPNDGADAEPDRPTETEAAETDDRDPFAEWPETARPPEDRSEEADDAESANADREVEADWPDPPGEDSAQADARRTVVGPDELPEDAESATPPDDRTEDRPDHGRVVSEPEDDDQPSVDELRNELNEQFESIKIVEPGQYELNLMELYDREEHIVSLQEDGRYVIDVPDSWVDADE